jgi:hypothetical protein
MRACAAGCMHVHAPHVCMVLPFFSINGGWRVVLTDDRLSYILFDQTSEVQMEWNGMEYRFRNHSEEETTECTSIVYVNAAVRCARPTASCSLVNSIATFTS